MNTESNAYRFDAPLIEGIIRKRRNRFIMEVEHNGTLYDCHCPTTGSIGGIVFSDIPCLLSKSKDPSRKTPYTVEAISLTLPADRERNWIGIDQNAANRYVEHFLSTGQLCNMVSSSVSLQREKKLGNSKLDFLVGDTFIEVKTPLQTLQVEKNEHIKIKKTTEFNSFDRFLKHINELAGSLQLNERAVLLTCFIYNNPGYIPAKTSKRSSMVQQEVAACIQRGIEIWQINLQISPTEVSLIDYFETTKNFITSL